MKPRILVLALIAALGSGCSSMDKPNMALHFEPVLSIHHGAPNAQSYYQLGRYYQGQKRLAQAEEAFLKAIAADERHADAYNALASLYAERGELERAVQMFQKVTAMAPDAAYLYNNLGYAYYLQGHQDKAYAAVRMALSLDQTLERAWVNLARIAAMSPESVFAEALKARRVDALPTELASSAAADESASTTSVGIALPGEQASPLASAGDLPAQADDQNMKFADTSVVDTAQKGAANAMPAVAAPVTTSLPPVPVPSSEELIAGGKFILLSASREVVSVGGSIEITTAAPATPGATGPGIGRNVGSNDGKNREMTIPAIRLEVSNGNGVSRFARKFSARLRGDSIPVARITNLSKFSLKKTVIEFQPGYETAARALMNRTSLPAQLVAASKPRPGSDVRIVLGRDALPFG